MKKAWKWEIRIFVGVVALVGLVIGIRHGRATATFRRHERDVAGKIAALRAQDPARPALFGDGEPGNGWEHYVRAMDAFAAIPEAELNEIPEVRSDYEFVPDPGKLEAVFAKYAAPILDELRQALSKRELVPPYRYEEGLTMDIPYVTKAIKLSKFLAGGAEYLHSKGRDREALEWLMLGLGMGQDMARRGPLINALVQFCCDGIAMEKWASILSGHSLAAADLESLAAALDRMEKIHPSLEESLLVEDVVCRRTLVLTEGGSAERWSLSAPEMPSWRDLFSRRLAAASALELRRRILQDAHSVIRTLPSHERAGALEKMERDYDAYLNPFIGTYLGKVYRNEAEAALNSVLMRVATALAWHEAEKGGFPATLQDLVPRYLPKAPECPYTGKSLGYSAGKVWSIGGDGKDDGGKPLSLEGDILSDGDVVLTVKRKDK